ncbi:MAG: UDP-N-acetylmuramate--L-alanine ligase [SAR116 cluster bacterium]|nr:UDP-N-acetylmuramate--L-alanine ligase [SAR116 cluster bacterium]
MSNIPQNFGVIHFIGIGGIGMSGIAEILHKSGYKVQGSDISKSKITARLEKMGIKVYIGHNKLNIKNSSIIVYSSAVKQDNQEIINAKANFIPIIHRSEMLGELMRLRQSIAIAGTHGKTTTTSLIAKLLEQNQMDPTIINGGIISSIDSNAKLGSGKWMVVEADESDGSFSRLNPTIAIVTNIDLEHMEFHKSESNLENAFINFISSIPFYGFACVCIDHPRIQKILSKLSNKKIITYGFSPNSDVRANNIRFIDGKMTFDVSIRKDDNKNSILECFEFPMIGNHNVQNALAAISLSLELKIPLDIIKESLKSFSGVQRRFQLIDTMMNTKIIDDYGHHPEEIKAALSATKLLKENGKVLAIFQPHRYSRLKNHFDEFCSSFNDADKVILLQVYSAGEKKLLNFENFNLEIGIRNYGHRDVLSVQNDDDIYEIISNEIKNFDIIIFLGAGNITNYANLLTKKLNILKKD